ncbi:hypothetical protein [Paenibacillus sp. P32E]|uniref:hypothetical protein n=1 Tax=Paenibacillus sp. P32E TaxID=1349434 RepID=UPI0015C19771|nr:hypothetical protein [Paenibacillus sp. P32E]
MRPGSLKAGKKTAEFLHRRGQQATAFSELVLYNTISTSDKWKRLRHPFMDGIRFSEK